MDLLKTEQSLVNLLLGVLNSSESSMDTCSEIFETELLWFEKILLSGLILKQLN